MKSIENVQASEVQLLHVGKMKFVSLQLGDTGVLIQQTDEDSPLQERIVIQLAEYLKQAEKVGLDFLIHTPDRIEENG